MDHKMDNIKKALTPDAPLHTDKDALWNAIEQELDKDKKQRRPLFFILIFLGLGLAAAGIYLVIQKNTENMQHQETALKQNEASMRDESLSVAQTKPALPTNSNNTWVDTITINQNKAIGNAKNLNSQRISSTQKQVNASLQPIRSDLLNAKENQIQTDHQTTKKGILNSKIVASDTFDQKEQTSDTVTDPQDEKGTETSRDLSMNSEKMPSSLYSVTPIALLKNNFIASGSEFKIDFPKSSQSNSELRPTPKKTWEWQLSSGIFMWDTYHQTYAPTFETINQRRNTISTPKESLIAMVMLKREILPNWYIGLGLQYNQMTEVIQADDILVTTKEITSDSALFYVGANFTEYFKGNLEQTTRKGYLIYSPNYIKRWNIPLEMSYKLALGRVHIVPSVSFLYNVSQRYEGIQLGMNGDFIYKDQEAFANVYRTSGLMSWAWAVDAEWSLSKKWALRIGLANQNDLNSVLRDDSLLSERYRQLGFNLGMKVKM